MSIQQLSYSRIADNMVKDVVVICTFVLVLHALHCSCTVQLCAIHVCSCPEIPPDKDSGEEEGSPAKRPRIEEHGEGTE